jgi:hypothetical protein
MDEIHVCLLRALAIDETPTERAERELDLALLDHMTWPVYVWEWLRLTGKGGGGRGWKHAAEEELDFLHLAALCRAPGANQAAGTPLAGCLTQGTPCASTSGCRACSARPPGHVHGSCRPPRQLQQRAAE